MPVVVDPEVRRQQVAKVVAEIIVSAGLEAVTIRSVAAAAGFSTAVVSHYFAGRRDLLLYSYKMAQEHAFTRLEAAVKESNGDSSQLLESQLPFTEEARRDWMVFTAFWAWSIADPEFSLLQREQFRVALKRVEEALLASLPETQRTDRKRIAFKARTLLSSLMGLSIQAAFDPEGWPEELQRAVLKDAVGELLPRPPDTEPPLQ
jgi:TetR/AcrR family transcriptional repressor of bet genes